MPIKDEPHNSVSRGNPCAYCRAEGASTGDHVPPRSLFEKGRRANLIQVPCCEDCRAEQTLDDEYFRTVITARLDAHEHPATRSRREATRRAFQRSEGLRRRITDRMGVFKVPTKSEIKSGKVEGLHVEIDRIYAVVERCVLGLYYHEMRTPLPEGYRAEVVGDHDFDRLKDFIKRCETRLEEGEWREKGDGVFRYRYYYFEEEPGASVWQLEFFGTVKFFGITIGKTLIRKLMDNEVATEKAN